MSDFPPLEIDLCSITVNEALTENDGEILFEGYRRHGAAVRQTLMKLMKTPEPLVRRQARRRAVTILSLWGIEPPETMDGKCLVPLS